MTDHAMIMTQTGQLETRCEQWTTSYYKGVFHTERKNLRKQAPDQLQSSALYLKILPGLSMGLDMKRDGSKGVETSSQDGAPGLCNPFHGIGLSAGPICSKQLLQREHTG